MLFSKFKQKKISPQNRQSKSKQKNEHDQFLFICFGQSYNIQGLLSFVCAMYPFRNLTAFESFLGILFFNIYIKYIGSQSKLYLNVSIKLFLNESYS